MGLARLALSRVDRRRDSCGSRLGLAGPSRYCRIGDLEGSGVEKVLAFKPGISGIPTQDLVGGD